MTLKPLLCRSIAAFALAGASALGALATTAHAATPAPIGAFTTKGAYSYISAPNLHPPKLTTTVKTQTSKLAKGDFLVDNFPNLTAAGPMTGEGGPLILDSKLQPVWFLPIGTNVTSTNLQQQTYNGKPVLTYWKGVVTSTGASTSGEVDIVDQHYRHVATIKATLPWIISVHDAVISGPNIWVTVYRTVPNTDLSAEGGSSSGILYDSGVQEYNIKTGKLEYTWDAMDHVPFSQAQQHAPPPAAAANPWDAYHINSIQLLPGNEMLVSLRNTWAAYLINTKTSQTIWTLGGNASSFKFAGNAAFAWQHDVRMLPHNQVSVFNDNCCAILGGGVFGPSNGASGGLVLNLNTGAHTVSLANSYTHKNPILDPAFLGSMSVLANGNALVGWGSNPYFSEYSKKGQLLLDARWPGKDLSYRALFTGNWVGTPFFPPSGAAHRVTGGKVVVYASWDGDTQVTSWKVLSGSNPNKLRVVASHAKTGFETAITPPKNAKVFKVQAFDSKGHLLRTSKAFSVPSGNKLPTPPPGSY
ncbi:MAG TPA: arylsulfotransferase family protein [Solirubrobacteraceae bacterium]|nr:arylsulfotransferase family protein [Solirubrobacteraceae bacterium]